MYAFGAHLNKPHLHFNVTAELRMDLQLWLSFLKTPQVYYRSFLDFDDKLYFSPLDFYTDASSTIGCGGIYQNEWFMITWEKDFLDKYSPSINYLELYGLTVAVLAWLPKFRNRNVIIFCDNQSVIYMVNNGTSGCKLCMILIRLLVLNCLLYNVKLKVKYIASKSNRYADSLSRMKYHEFRRLAKTENREFKKFPIEIPECLWPMEKLFPEIDQKTSKRINCAE